MNGSISTDNYICSKDIHSGFLPKTIIDVNATEFKLMPDSVVCIFGRRRRKCNEKPPPAGRAESFLFPHGGCGKQQEERSEGGI